MYTLTEFIPSGCFVTSNPVPVNYDIRDITSMHTDNKGVYINIKDSRIHISTKSKIQANKIIKDIMLAIASEAN